MWKLAPSKRLSAWRIHRQTLDTLSFAQAIQSTAEFWQSCPYKPYYLDPTCPNSWPSPWELISENYYCDLAKALGMIYTLHLSKHSPILDPSLHVYLDPKTGYTYNLPVFDSGNYVLNLTDNLVVNTKQINKSFELMQKFNKDALRLQEY